MTSVLAYYSRASQFSFFKPMSGVSLNSLRRIVDWKTDHIHFRAYGPIDAVLAAVKLKEDLKSASEAKLTKWAVLSDTIPSVIKVAVYISSLGVPFGRFWDERDAKTLKDGLDLLGAAIDFFDKEGWQQLFPSFFKVELQTSKSSPKAGCAGVIGIAYAVALKLLSAACIVGSTVSLLVKFKPEVVPSICSKNNVYGAVVLFDTAQSVAKLISAILGVQFIGKLAA